MQRRKLVLGWLAAQGAARIARAQPSRRIARVGVLLGQPAPNGLMKSFADAMHELGAFARNRAAGPGRILA
jgi:hypothetical protein